MHKSGTIYLRRMKDSAKLSLDKPQSYLLWQADYVWTHAWVSERGSSWTAANNLNVILSAQEKYRDILEYLKLH
jgi:hypothetical protein